jgi:hypothetical protein
LLGLDRNTQNRDGRLVPYGMLPLWNSY